MGRILETGDEWTVEPLTVPVQFPANAPVEPYTIPADAPAVPQQVPALVPAVPDYVPAEW